MNRLFILTFLIALGLTNSADATWPGKGELVGTVTASRMTGFEAETVFFELKLESQKMEDGPEFLLGHDITSFYSGDDMEAISAGDRLRIKVNSGNNYGIRVESVEFIEDQPGSPDRSKAIEWLATVIVCGLAAFVYVVTRIRVTCVRKVSVTRSVSEGDVVVHL